MDQKKIGSFMKELRKGKKLTQEQIAEQFHDGKTGIICLIWTF